MAIALETKPPAEDLSLRYSSFSKFINVISWICRFCSNTRKPQAERIWSSQLTVQEINAAEILLFKQQQAQFFPKEQIALKSGMTVSSSSSIYSLRPILDSEGLIRVQGRLSQSELPYSQQHPIILHRKAHLTELLVQCLHFLHLHAVKSAKSLLRKLLGTLSLTVEEYATILTDVEATLNSRPLCPMNTQPEDGLDVLTPGHFLIGRSLSALPQHPMEKIPTSSKKRWNMCQKVSTEFWQRWSKEYLQTLQRRQEWKNPQRFQCGRRSSYKGSGTICAFLASCYNYQTPYWS